MKLVAVGSQILFSRVGQVLANAAVVLLIANILGPTGQGHYSLTVAVVMLLASLLGGGMGLAAVPPLRHGRVRLTRMFAAQMIWCGAMVAVLLALAWGAAGGHWQGYLQRNLGWMPGVSWLAALAAVGMLGFEVYSYNLLARGHLVVGSAVNGARATGHLALVGVLVLTSGLTLGRAVGALALAQFAGMVMMLVVVMREMRGPDPVVQALTDTGTAMGDLNQHSLVGLVGYNLRHGWLGQISAVAYFLLLRLDQGLLVHYRGAAEVGIYSIAVYLGEMLWLLPGALTPLLVHSSAAPANNSERDQTAARAVRLGVLVTFAAGLPLFFFVDFLLGIFAGGQYASAGPAFRALLPGIIVFAPGAVLAGDFIGRGKPHWNTQASALTVVVNLAIGVWLIPTHGAVGAAWASTIAYACGSITMLCRFRQATQMSLRGLVLGRHRDLAPDPNL